MNKFKERKTKSISFNLLTVVDDAHRLFKTVVTCFNDERPKKGLGIPSKNISYLSEANGTE